MCQRSIKKNRKTYHRDTEITENTSMQIYLNVCILLMVHGYSYSLGWRTSFSVISVTLW